MALDLDENNFHKTILNSKGVALVDFWAPWCGACRRQLPIIEDLSKEMSDEILIAKVNVENSQNLANIFKISSIPTLIIFKDGKIAETMTGVHTKEQLKTTMGNYL